MSKGASEGESVSEIEKSKFNAMRRRSSDAAPLLLLLPLLLTLAAARSDEQQLVSRRGVETSVETAARAEATEANEVIEEASSLVDIEDLAPGAVISTFRGSPFWKILPDLFVRRTALVECEGGQVSRE